MNWTDDQKKVIDTRERNILVSAAAGSGKTAVMVERIMRLVTDPVNPCNIDELLVVTFTRAAAGEMKERIAGAIADAYAADPDNEHLARQQALLSRAAITTIDSFCLDVVRNYGCTAGITPGFRTAGSAETKLLSRDTVKMVVDEAYEAEGDGAAEFEAFAESISPGKTDRLIEELILSLYEEASSDPYPGEWLRSLIKAENNDVGGDSPWLREYMEDIRIRLELIKRYAVENAMLAADPAGPASYAPAAASDLEFITELEKETSYEGMRERGNGWKAENLSRAKAKEGENPALRERFKKNRDEIKSGISKMLNSLLLEDLDSAGERMAASSKMLSVLVTLTEKYAEKFTEAKQRAGIMDFSDIEHTALQILTGENGRSEAAEELSLRYREIMIDEYQDSNYLQEAVLTAVSAIPAGRQNYFTVGDVKQSIYSFRQARPELFMNRSRLFKSHPDQGVKIDLHQNFRSRKEVIDTVNSIFSVIMREEIGGIDYDAEAELHEGAGYPEDPGFETELMPVYVGERDESGERYLEETGSSAAIELEARAIGTRILKLMSGGEVRDRADGALRKPEFRDIVILIRTVRGVADQMVRVLASMGIPAYSESRTGYFDAPEVQSVLSFLEVLDNPYQEIPLTAVLMSAIGGMNAEDLAWIRAEGAGAEGLRSGFYGMLRWYAKNGERAGIRERALVFLSLYDRFRESVSFTPIHELIGRIYDETGFLHYAAALPGGAQRMLNLRMLEDMASGYEKTGYTGLFNFVRYIRNLKLQEAEPDEAASGAGDGNVVRICSIHKSKGLEYPIVFAAGLGRKFNTTGWTGNVLVHHRLGIAADYVDLGRRVKIPTLKKKAVSERLKRDLAGEELRILYVAMTRAKQKLILSGTITDENALRRRDILDGTEDRLPAGYILGAGSFFDWILPAAFRIFREDEKTGRKPFLILREAAPSTLAASETDLLVRREIILRELRETAPEDGQVSRMLDRRLSFRYPWAGRENIPVEMSVSEIKRRNHEDLPGSGTEERPASFYPAEDGETVPEFIRLMRGEKRDASEVKLSSAEKGTAVHRVMELLDYTAVSPDGACTPGEIISQMEGFVKAGTLGHSEAISVDPERIAGFVNSSLGRRMAAAFKEGRLVREQPFVTAYPASAISGEWPSDEEIFVQGIIDAYFTEAADDGCRVVLVDYKTDRVSDGEQLVRRYKVQLDAYAEALEKSLGLPVSEKLIWAFSLGKEIVL